MVSQKIRNKLIRYKKLLREQSIKVTKLLLFGSHAKGEAHKHSDIDVCVITPDVHQNPDLYRRIIRTARQIDPVMESIAITPHDYKYNWVSPLLDQVRKTAIEIR